MELFWTWLTVWPMVGRFAFSSALIWCVALILLHLSALAAHSGRANRGSRPIGAMKSDCKLGAVDWRLKWHETRQRRVCVNLVPASGYARMSIAHIEPPTGGRRNRSEAERGGGGGERKLESHTTHGS